MRDVAFMYAVTTKSLTRRKTSTDGADGRKVGIPVVDNVDGLLVVGLEVFDVGLDVVGCEVGILVVGLEVVGGELGGAVVGVEVGLAVVGCEVGLSVTEDREILAPKDKSIITDPPTSTLFVRLSKKEVSKGSSAARSFPRLCNTSSAVRLAERFTAIFIAGWGERTC